MTVMSHTDRHHHHHHHHHLHFHLYFIISSFICIVPFVLGAFCHLFNKRILDWIIHYYYYYHHQQPNYH